jgi:hypothetical protein
MHPPSLVDIETVLTLRSLILAGGKVRYLLCQCHTCREILAAEFRLACQAKEIEV